MRYIASSFFILLCLSKSIIAEELLTCNPTYQASTNLHTPSNVENNPEVIGDDLVVPANSVVGRVYITRLPIFDESDPGENNLIFRWANRFHILTTPKTIEQELLFKSGSPYESRVLEESGRLLRNANFLYDSTIKPVSHCNGITDIEVVTRDVWSFTPEASIDRSGGNNNYRLSLSESNLFGAGKLASISHKKDIDRISTKLAYEDNNIRGTRVSTRLALTKSDDGKSGFARLALPFYSLDSKQSWEVRFEEVDRTDTQFFRGKKVSELDHKIDDYRISYGFSKGLIGNVVQRWLVGYAFRDDEFSDGDSLPAPVTLAIDKRLSYPFIQYQSLEDNFAQAFNIDQIYRTEDLHLGHNFNFKFGYAATEFGSDQNRATIETSYSDTLFYNEKALLLHQFSLSGLWNFDTNEDEDLVTQYEMRYFRSQAPLRSFFASISGTFSHNLNINQQVVLGGDTGARGYDSRFQTGDHRIVLTLEERQYTDWHILNLVRPGFAIFVDAGRVWQAGISDNLKDKYLLNAGFGIRLASSKADVGSIVHIDFAFPLTNRNEQDVDSLQITVNIKKSL
ncbi:MAG: outer membrane protein assembly factor BamA [Candidatus Azotimanducaceae bacterium]|jgi:outer membrane protein assembly factor BamA